MTPNVRANRPNGKAAELEDAPELWAFLKGARWAERYYGIGGATTGEQR